MFSIFVPRTGTLTLTPGMGMGGPFSTPKSQTNHKKSKTTIVRKVFTLLGDVSKNMKNIFKIFSYIQKTTTNPINALKITIHSTKHTKNTQFHFEKQSKAFVRLEQIKNSNKIKLIFYYISNLHNSYLVYFVYFIFFIYFVFIYIHVHV